MALTAARTELDIALVGQDETQRMLEEAKARMAALEGQTKSLTAATKTQTAAAVQQRSALEATNDKMKGLAARAEGVVGGVDKIKGAFDKVVGTLGFVGMAVQGAIAGFTFLKDLFDDSAEKAEKHAKKLEAAKRETERLKEATDRLSSSLSFFQGVIKGAGAALATQRATLAELQGDMETAAFERAGVAIEQNKAQIEALSDAQTKAWKQNREQVSQETESRLKIRDIDEKIAKAKKAESQARSDLIQRFDKEEARTRRDAATAQIAELNVAKAAELARMQQAKAAIKSGEEAYEQLSEQLRLEKEIANQRLVNLGKVASEEQKPAKPSGGGGGRGKSGPSPEDVEREALERAKRLQDTKLALFEEDLRAEQARQRRMQKEMLGEENVAAAAKMRESILAELAKLPTDATAKAFEPLKAELQKQLKALDAVTESHVNYTIGAMFFTDEQDKVIDAWEKEQEAIGKVKESIDSLAEAQKKAAEEAAKMRDELARAVPADFFENLSGPLEQLGKIAAPAFEAVSDSVSGITAQLAKYKEGQQSLTASLIGSSGAIAGAIAKQVDNVRVEAGIRAIFEGAMGFATMFTNPAQSAGHFTAATMFGLAAGGVIKTGGGAGGGQKAKDSKPAASTRESGMSGGGGPITNVYNLQTGIIDGQSTALAFRRAEQTARNTGMASAGGW